MNRGALSLVSLNIERDKHLDLVIPFLKERNADVVCLQELFDADIPRIEEALGARCFFLAQNRYPSERGAVAEGVGIFTRFPVLDARSLRYAGNEGALALFKEGGTTEEKSATQLYALAFATIEKDGERFKLATTHFPWTENGEADDLQREAVARMLDLMAGEGELILCGDFNAPRGREIFSAIAEKYKDNVPVRYATSIDGSLHRAGPLPYMVDGLFSTPGYAVSDVEMICGISDHCALAAGIRHTPV